MKKATLSLLILLSVIQLYAWGQTGHRVVGQVAQHYLTKKARKNIEKVLGHETLAEASTFMDFIKSDNTKRHMNPWHYMTIPDDKTYDQVGKPEEGDVLSTIKSLVAQLKSKKFAEEDEAFALKCLIHLVGDIHQPLHVGNGNDRGGNDIKLEFFWENSNLHRVWDSGIIDKQKYSYTEYTNWINHPSEEDIENWQGAEIIDWANESKSYRSQVYDLPDNKKINYRYVYDNIDLVNQRLLQAGVRLAGILNQIYG